MLKVIDNKNADILRVVKTNRKGNIKTDKNGNTKVIATSKGYQAETIIGNSKIGSTTTLDISNNESRVDMFEFLARATGVEWETFTGNKADGTAVNMIGTKQSEGSMGFLQLDMDKILNAGG